MQRFQRHQLAVAVGLTVSASAAWAVFTEVNNNPFDDITSTGAIPSLVMMDLDGDDDLDAVLFHTSQDEAAGVYNYGGVTATSVWENTGTASAAAFSHVGDVSGYGGDNIAVNPFVGDFQSYYGHPVSAADADGDGDVDFFGGQRCSYGEELYFAVTETDGYGVVTGATQFTNYTGYGTGNPFYGLDLAPSGDDSCGRISFAAGDLDNDTDIDLIVSDLNTLRVYRNDGVSNQVYVMTELAGVDNPFGSAATLSGSYYGAPIVLNDIDLDGDLDFAMGTASAANMRLFENVGTAGVADFSEVDPGAVDIATSGWASPSFADMDGDGDDDLLIVSLDDVTPKLALSTEQRIRFYRNDANDPPLIVPDDDDDGFFGGVGLAGLFAALGGLLLRRRRR